MKLKNNSVANKTILAELEAKLVKADVTVPQYPLWWHHFLALMQKWVEDTFQHGFSHGSTGDKLKRKKLVVSVTFGAPDILYHKNAAMGFEIEEFLAPVKAACGLCGIEFAGYIYTGGVSYQSRDDAAAMDDMVTRSKDHADRVVAPVSSL